MQSYNQSKDDLIRRLRKIEGQVKGIQRMVEDDKYCMDVLIQIAAVRAAINKVGTIMFEQHTRGCIKKAIENNQSDHAIDELLEIMSKFVH